MRLDVDVKREIIAVVTIDPGVVGGGVPIFYARTHKEREDVSRLIANALQGSVHDIGNGAYIVAKH